MDTMVFTMNPETPYLTRHSIQLTLLSFVAVYLVFTDLVIIAIALYFGPPLNILLDCIRTLDDSSVLKREKNFFLLLHIYHNNIIEKLQAFSKLFYYTFIVQLSASFLLLLFMFFMMQKTHDYHFLCPMILGIFFQFSAFCFFGAFIFGKTEQIFTELYLTKWYEFSNKDKQILMLMMMMSQRPFGFKAAGIYDINLVMFINVTKLAFSYCTILYALTQ
ncbi:odorant receptor 67c-like [Phlebotomus argentipes]|uniref:odorant receptor 67c-like n=1 Tax=Phlebotomus argentipes TaxID=94469 RepID=UPI0028932F1F|nr:odorant receptor 67c-like [Phlebotomus argentipes]